MVRCPPLQSHLLRLFLLPMKRKLNCPPGYCPHIPSSGPLIWLSPLHGNSFPNSNLTSSKRPSLTILPRRAPPFYLLSCHLSLTTLISTCNSRVCLLPSLPSVSASECKLHEGKGCPLFTLLFQHWCSRHTVGTIPGTGNTGG